MPKQIVMKFLRDEASGPACLEYSWVPEGVRNVIRLGPGQKEGMRPSSIPDDVKPSQVQVYVLSNNARESVANWQFPPGPPYVDPVDGATVVVSQEQMKVVGTVHYTNNTMASDTQPLEPISRPCPQGPGER